MSFLASLDKYIVIYDEVGNGGIIVGGVSSIITPAMISAEVFVIYNPFSSLGGGLVLGSSSSDELFVIYNPFSSPFGGLVLGSSSSDEIQFSVAGGIIVNDENPSTAAVKLVGDGFLNRIDNVERLIRPRMVKRLCGKFYVQGGAKNLALLPAITISNQRIWLRIRECS